MKELLLLAHIVAGSLALAGALVAATAKMSNAAHRWHIHSGRVFVGGMSAVFFTAVPLAFVGENFFLLLVAVFSGYLAWSGWSYAKNRDGVPRGSDWARACGMLAAAVVMAAYGARLALSDDDNGVTLLVFCGIGAALSLSDIKILRAGSMSEAQRIRRHLTMMLAGLIAAVTAFVVVNFTFEPAFLRWLAPTAVITPVIIHWNRKIRGGFTPRGMRA